MNVPETAAVWQFVADVHGASERLRDAADPDFPLALLGDNLNLVDYHDLSGVAAKVLSPDDIARILSTLAEHGPAEALDLAGELFFDHPEKMAHARVEIRRQYEELARVLPPRAVVLHGNVDWPDLLAEAVPDGYADVRVMDVAGVRVGFLSGTGAYPFSMNLPGEETDRHYAEKLWSLGPVDVLCTHFPPAVEGVTFDEVARRDEGGGTMLRDYILETKPRLHLFGHIHNPRVPETRLGSTLLKNVGGFRYHGRVHAIDLARI